jgi:hypothetical protein
VVLVAEFSFLSEKEDHLMSLPLLRSAALAGMNTQDSDNENKTRGYVLVSKR